MSEQNKAIVLQAYTNFKAGKIDALLDLMADEVTWTLPTMENVPFAGARTGRQSVGEFFATVGASQEVLQFEPREMIAEGDKVVALAAMTGESRQQAVSLMATSPTSGPFATARSPPSTNTPTPLPAPTLIAKP
jgi:ketosteroid isomerase-like protein